MDIKKKILKLKSLRKKIKNKTSIGGWMQTTEPMIAELLGQRNFDWIVLDIEHGTFDTSKLQNVFRAIELNNKLPLVRLANHDKKVLGQLFDSGCCGVIIPNITSSKDLENIIKSCSWPPNGSRGVGFSRSNLFGLKFNQYKKIAQKPFIVAMIENLKALKNLNKILKVKGLDCILIGPYDLSASLGSAGDFSSKKFIKTVNSIKKNCKKNKIPVGIHLVDPTKHNLFKLKNEGYTFIPYSTDTVLINKALDAYLD